MSILDTIAAISTPYGKGGVALIRISGENAIKVASKVFVSSKGDLCSLEPNRAYYGQIVNEGERIDDGIITIFRAPHSFTGEDTVEISCHGGIVCTANVLSACLTAGARTAGPGEFSQRAFLNGKMDLSQAEAIIDLIDAETESAAKLASAQSQGLLSKEIARLREKLTDILGAAYVLADYPDEDLSSFSDEDARIALENALKEIETLLDTYKTGKAISHGVNTVICGKPNTGKSSLLNALLGEERAIVTDIPGTTRDTIEERCVVGDITLNLCDTAGIHKGVDQVEQIGIERSRLKMSEAELVLAVFDYSSQLSQEDRDIISSLTPSNTIIVLNKCECQKLIDDSIFDAFERIVCISCADSIGLDTLKQKITDMFINGEINYHSPMLTNARQSALCQSAKVYIQSAIDSLVSGAGADVAGLDVELALGILGEIDGSSVSNEIVNNIFSRFCVGK